MKRDKLISIFILFLIALYLSACNGSCLNMKEKEVKKLLHSQLSIGDNRDKVEAALDGLSLQGNAEIQFSYDKYSNRYQATIVDEKQCGRFQGIGIYINFNDSGELTEIDVHKFYTMP